MPDSDHAVFTDLTVSLQQQVSIVLSYLELWSSCFLNGSIFYPKESKVKLISENLNQLMKIAGSFI